MLSGANCFTSASPGEVRRSGCIAARSRDRGSQERGRGARPALGEGGARCGNDADGEGGADGVYISRISWEDKIVVN